MSAKWRQCSCRKTCSLAFLPLRCLSGRRGGMGRWSRGEWEGVLAFKARTKRWNHPSCPLLAHCKPLCKTPAPALTAPQSYAGMQAEEEKSFCYVFPCFFISKSSPEGSCGPCTFLNSHSLPDCGGLLENTMPGQSSCTETHCLISSHLHAVFFWVDLCQLCPPPCSLSAASGWRWQEPVTSEGGCTGGREQHMTGK